MSLSCASDGVDCGAEWWWYEPKDESLLATKRGRKCCSCKGNIMPGELAREIPRFRPSTEFEEMRGIADDEVRISSWYFCEACGDLAESLSELGFCYSLGESLKQQITDYQEAT